MGTMRIGGYVTLCSKDSGFGKQFTSVGICRWWRPVACKLFPNAFDAVISFAGAVIEIWVRIVKSHIHNSNNHSITLIRLREQVALMYEISFDGFFCAV